MFSITINVKLQRIVQLGNANENKSLKTMVIFVFSILLLTYNYLFKKIEGFIW